MSGYLLFRSQKSQSKIDTAYIFSCIHATTKMDHSRFKLVAARIINDIFLFGTLHSCKPTDLALLSLSVIDNNHTRK